MMSSSPRVQDTTFQTAPSAIPTLEDEYSGAIPFSHFPAAERAYAAQATYLLAAASIGPRASAAEAQQLLSLLTAADEAAAAAARSGATSTSTSSDLLTGLYPLSAFALVVTPPWAAEQRPVDDAGFKAVAQSKELAAAVAALKDAPSGLASVARLAYGVALAAMQDSLDSFEEGKGASALVAAAIDAGALQHMVRDCLAPLWRRLHACVHEWHALSVSPVRGMSAA